MFSVHTPCCDVPDTYSVCMRCVNIYRSDTEVVNTLHISVSVLYMNEADQLTELCKISPTEKYNIPLPVVYGKYQSLFFKPHVDG